MLTFDDSPMLFLAFGNLLLVFVGLLSFYPFLHFKVFRDRIFIIAAICLSTLVLVMLRLPVVVFNEVLNPDENLFIVGAMTLAQDPIYWESVDGCTSGPFNFYIITFFCQVFNQPYDYISARVVGIILMAGSIIFNFLALQRLFSTGIAFASLFPAVTFLSTTRYFDFVHFSSEHLPILLLSIMAYQYASIHHQITVKSSTVFALGLVAGAIIFAKLQAIPMALLLTLVTYWLVFQKDHKSFKKQALWLTLGGILVPLCLLLMGFRYNFADKIWIYYIQNNLSYGSNSNIFYTIYQSLFDDTNIFIRIIAVLLVFVVVQHLIRKKQFRPTPQRIFTIVFLFGTLLSVYKTGFVFHHYLLFLIFPTVFLYAYFLKELLSLSQKIVPISLLTVVFVVVLSKTLIYPFFNHFVTNNKPQRPLPVSGTGKEIMKYSRPNEALVVWGDNGRLYLETKRKQGIRWSNSHWGMYSDSLQKAFQQEFIKEFQQKPFPVFVDAHPTKGTFMTRDKLGYEMVTPLKEIISKNYTFIGEFDEQRVFVRNERFEEINK